MIPVGLMLLHPFGLVHPLAKFLDAQAGRRSLWGAIAIVSFVFMSAITASLLAVIVVGAAFYKEMPNETLLLIPGLFVIALFLLHVIIIAGGYANGERLVKIPGGWWVMSQDSPHRLDIT